MSESVITTYNKVDIAFSKGYDSYRSSYYQQMGLHLLQALGLVIFLPIDATLLDTGHLMILA
jgi:hypothetical protein